MSQKMLMFPIGLLLLALLLLLISSMNFLLTSEKFFLYIAMSIFLGGLIIYLVSPEH